MTRGAIAAGLAATAACSAILDFDEIGRPCTADNECQDGFTCLVRKCYPNGSVEEGSTCSSTALCVEGLVCAVPDFVCRRRCADAFFGDAACAGDRVCAQRFSAEGDAFAVCVAPDCGGAEACSAGTPGAAQVCVAVGDAGVCLEECRVLCAAGTCRDDCTLTSDGPQLACQLVGGAPSFACVAEDPANLHGHSCDLGGELCADNLACVRPAAGGVGLCLKYCDPVAADPCAGVCDPRTDQPAACTSLAGSTFVCGALPPGEISRGDGAAWRSPTACD